MILSDVTIKRPVLATVLNLIIVLIGLVAWQRLEVRQYPRVDLPVVTVETSWRAASADIMESQVTKILEDSIGGIEGVNYVSSSTATGRSTITVNFRPAINPDAAAADVRDRVNRARKNLPNDIDEPIITKASSDAAPIMFVALSSDTVSPMEVTAYASKLVSDRLQIIPGVASANIYGAREYSMRLWLDPDRMAAHQVTVDDITSALAAQNVEIPAGRIEDLNREFAIRSETDLKTVEDFRAIVLRRAEGYLVRLGDVAKVEIAPADERRVSRRNGKPSVALGIIKQATANPLEISAEVAKVVPEIQKMLPSGINIDIAYDSTIFISASIASVTTTMIEAIVLVGVVILLFLRSPRAAFIPLVTIPVSLLGGLVLMMVLGFSINMLTLLAFVLAIGLVVDDAIVMLENISRYIEQGMKPVEAALKGSKEIGFAIIAMTLTLAAVYAPMALAQGKTGRLFTEFALALAGAVIVSGFTALTLTPMLCSKLLRRHPGHVDEKEVFYVKKYRGWLTAILKRKKRTLGAAGFSLFLSLVLFMGLGGVANLLSFGAFSDKISAGQQQIGGLSQLSNPMVPPSVIAGLPPFVRAMIPYARPLGIVASGLPRELAPSEDQGFFIGVGLGPSGATIDATSRYALQAEKIYAGIPEARMYFVIAGVPTVSDMLSFIALKDWSERDRSISEIIGSIFPAMSGITGLAAFPIPPGGLGQDFLDMPVGLVIQTTGSWEELGMVVNQVMAKAAQNPVLQNVQSTLYLDTPELHLDINRDKVAAVGSSIGDVGRAMQVMMGGLELTRFKLNNEQYDVILQLGKEQRRQPTDLTGLYVRGSGGQMVQLANLVDVKEAIGPRSLDHFDKLRSATIKAGLAPGASQAAALAYLEQAVHDTGITGLHTDYTGSSRELKETGSTIGLVFGLALIFIFLVLAAQFESFVDPFVILVSVPLAVFGALFALTFAGKSMNIYSQIGLITLVGLIAKNGILIVEFANQQMEQHGLSRTDAVIEAALLRLRPILMTTAATVLGAMPLALAHGASAEARSTIGWVIVGGMTLGTLFTLFVVPVVYTLVGRKSVAKPQIG